MRQFFIITMISASFCCSPVFAQGGMGTTMPALSATTPLGTDPGTPVAGTGIPMGPAVSSSPVVSSLPSYPTGAGTTACSTLGTAPTAMTGSPSSYDGGGVTLNGTAAPATASTATSGTGAASPMSSGSSATAGLATTSGIAATAGMCGSGSSSVAASSAPTSASSAAPSARAGIPLDSTEINNLGVSSWAAVQGAGAASSVTTSTTP